MYSDISLRSEKLSYRIVVLFSIVVGNVYNIFYVLVSTTPTVIDSVN